MKRYEYKIVSKLFNVEDKLNTLGSQGWELIAIDNHVDYVFKREMNE